ncbi:MAG: prepilin-type N-terminal cleavage/methylation domain-containing protein [Desulfurivibrio sp.]|nr:prepilin-type N-terminal cleavage/methylation domain-containing protein [Desulfurivibrio sp.]MBU3937562.1 prepilin-type N-terminal cleavage/methylation domain-containing protein [Pseudomonadota bacterium]MBU4117686.1 prepilin-type N-terminal cleavage/methylation domain-containing protein [Pseudomonadota bacterium]
MSRKRLTSNEDGFTLIEVMIAITLMAIGLLAVAATPIMVMSGNSRAQRVTEASFGAMNRLEQLMVLDNSAAELTTGNHTATTTVGGVAYTVNWAVTDLDTSRKNVAVTVLWNEGLLAKQFQYAYVKTDFM